MASLDNIILNLKVNPDNKSIREATSLIKELEKSLKSLDKTSLKYIKTLNSLNRALRGVNGALGKTSKAFKEASTDASTFAGKMGKANKKITSTTKQSTKSISSFGGSLGAINPIAGAASLAITGLASAVISGATKYAEFQAQVALTGGLLQATAAETRQLEQSALELGSTTAFTAAQVANLQEELAKRGFTVDEIVGSTEQVLGLAQAFKIDLGKAAGIASGTIRAFGLDVDETGRVVDVVGKLAGSSGAGVLDFGEAISSIGAVAQLNNISLETQATLYGKLADSQIKGTKAGTVIKNLQGELFNSSGKLAKATGLYAKTQEDIIPILQKLKSENLSFTEIQQIFGKVSAAGVGILIKQADSLENLKGQLKDAGGFTDNLAKKQKQTLAGSFTAASSAIDGLLIRGFKPFEQATISIVNTFTDLISKTTEYISENDTLVDIVETLVDIVQGLIPIFLEWFEFIQPLIGAIGNLAFKIVNFVKTLFNFGKVVKRVISENKTLNAVFKLLQPQIESLTALIDTLSSVFDFFTDSIASATAELENNSEAAASIADNTDEIADSVTRNLGARKGVTEEMRKQIGKSVQLRLEEEATQKALANTVEEYKKMNENSEVRLTDAKEIKREAGELFKLSTNIETIERARLQLSDKFASSIEQTTKDLKAQGKNYQQIFNITNDLIDAELEEQELAKEQAKLDKEALKISKEQEKQNNKVKDARAAEIKIAKQGLKEINTLRDLELIKLKESFAKGIIDKREFELKKLKLSAEASQKQVDFVDNEISASLRASQEFVVIRAKANLKALEDTKSFYEKVSFFREEDLQNAKDARQEDLMDLESTLAAVGIAADRMRSLTDIQVDVEIARLDSALAEGLVTREEYEIELLKIQRKGTEERIKTAEAEVERLNASSELIKANLQSQLDAGDISKEEFASKIQTLDDLRLKKAADLILLLQKLRQKAAAQEDKEEENRLTKLTERFGKFRDASLQITKFFSDLNQKKLDEVNQQIVRQESKVQQAIQLAELGNTAILNEELKRQKKLEEERRKAEARAKKFAAVQEALNKSLALSNSIVAVTRVAAESGIASVAAIPAIIGVIAAGTGVLTSLIGGFFKDGVIDFNGKGTGTSDSNLVAISNGESVITANGTRKAPEALKLINEGKLSDKDLGPAYGLNGAKVDTYPVPVNTFDVSGLLEQLNTHSTLLNSLVDEVQNFDKKIHFSDRGYQEHLTTRQGRTTKLKSRI